MEKDNLKLLVYEIGGIKARATRLFAGQITFAPEVLRDGFIAEPEKFDNQIKIAFAQKEMLRGADEVLLYISPDKVFTKTLPASDSVDSFVHGLPYFKEELIINSEDGGQKTEDGRRITYTAFEKKLVEDLQRPFQAMGKKIIGVKSAANVLTEKFSRTGSYLFLVPLEKEIVAVAAQNGEILDLAVIKNEVFAARLEEFRSAHNLLSSPVFSVGVFPTQHNLQAVSLAPTDIYDLIVNSSLKQSDKLALPEFFSRLNPRYFLLVGAAMIGAILIILIVRNVNRLPSLNKPEKTEITSPVAPPLPAAPEPQPKDYPVAILNGTLVTGEAGRLAEILKGLGFEITETKNATSAGFAATRLRATNDVPDKITAGLKTTLLETYESVSLEPLATPSANAVIEIILGKKKTE